MAKSDKKIMFASHCANFPTGFGRVNREVSGYLSKFYKFDSVGWQFRGEPVQIRFLDQPQGEEYTLCPAAEGGNYNEFGQLTFPQYIPWGRPDVVITLADWFVFASGAHNGFINHNNHWLPRFLLDTAKAFKKPIHNVWYFPIDSTPINKAFTELLEITEVPVVMSRYGSKELQRLGLDHEYIPHGVNPQQFKMNSEEVRMKSRRDVAERFKTHPVMNKELLKKIEDCFIVFWGGRNQIRKMPQFLAEVSGKFAQDKEDVMFIYHTSPVPYEVGITLPFHLERFNIQDKVIFTEASQVYFPHAGFLCNLMNCADAYLDTAGGEGFGFFRLEAAACGLARVMINWTTSAELMGLPDSEIAIRIEDALSNTRKDGTMDNIKTESGFLVPPMMGWGSGVGADFGLIDVDKAVEALNYLYDHKEECHRMGRKGNQFAYANYTWDQVLPKWHDLMEDIFANEQEMRERMEAIGKGDSSAKP